MATEHGRYVPKVKSVQETLAMVHAESKRENFLLAEEYANDFLEIIQDLLANGGCVVRTTEQHYFWKEIKNDIPQPTIALIKKAAAIVLNLDRIADVPKGDKLLSIFGVEKSPYPTNRQALFLAPGALSSLNMNTGAHDSHFFNIGRVDNAELISFLSVAGDELLREHYSGVSHSIAFSYIPPKHLIRCILYTLAPQK